MSVRELDTECLRTAARDYAGQFLLPTIANPHHSSFAPIGGRGWVINSMYNFHFKDEFDFVHDEIKKYLGPAALAEFDEAAGKRFTPRSEDVFHRLLAERLAVTPDGTPIPGKLGMVKRGSVVIGWRVNRRGLPRLVKVDVQVGETEEEAIFRGTMEHQNHNVVVFPMSQYPATMMALNTRISNEAAIAGIDAITGRLNEGSAAAIIQGRSGTQPADPDTAASGTLLFTLVCSDPVFPGGADANPGGRVTASAITNDSSADATGTLGYCRGCASNDAATSLDDHIDGEAGTSGADFNFNTISIVSGATVSLSSWTVTMPES